MARKDVMTPREKAFVTEYLANGMRAADAYAKCITDPTATSSRDPKSINCRVKSSDFLKRPRVKAAVEAATTKLAERTTSLLAEKYAASKERVVDELCKIAFSDFTDLHEWDEERGVVAKSSGEIPDEIKGAIVDVSDFKGGKEGGKRKMKIKMGDKQAALEKLARILGLYAEPEKSGPTLAVQFVIEK